MRVLTRLLLVFLLLCVGCELRDVPCFSPDGKEIAFRIRPERGDAKVAPDVREVGILTLADGKIRKFTLPEKFSASGLVWIGPRLFVDARRPKKVVKKGEGTHDLFYLVLDQATDKFSEAPFKPHIVRTPFVGRFKGKPCIYVADMDTEKTKIYSADDLKLIGSLPFEANNAGRE